MQGIAKDEGAGAAHLHVDVLGHAHACVPCTRARPSHTTPGHAHTRVRAHAHLIQYILPGCSTAACCRRLPPPRRAFRPPFRLRHRALPASPQGRRLRGESDAFWTQAPRRGPRLCGGAGWRGTIPEAY